MNARGRVAVITGAGSGIGRAVSCTLAERGYRLVLVGRRPDPLEETALLCSGDRADIVTATGDVTREDDVARVFASARTAFGRIDLLFNNAGVSATPNSIETIPLSDWERVISTNLTGAFLCLREAFRVMKDQSPRGGRIINNGSISATSPRPRTAPYCASKHAISGLTKSASLDGREFDIACGQIDIGNAASDMGAAVQQGALQANGAVTTEPVFDVALVGDAVAYMDSLPLDANVQFMTVLATKMPFIGRG